MEIQDSTIISTNTIEDGDCCFRWGWKTWPPTWTSLKPPHQGSCGTSLQSGEGWKSRLPIQPLMVDVEVGPSFFLWCLTGVIIFLSCLVAPFPVLSLEKAVFQWGFFFFSLVWVHWCFCIASFSGNQSGIHEAKGKPRKFCHVVLFVPRSLSGLLSSTSQRFYIIFSKFLAVFGRRNREKCLYSISLEVEVLICLDF